MKSKRISISRNLILVFIILARWTAFGQAPELVSFQAVARDSNENLLSNSTILVRFSLHNLSITGPIVYQEEHSTSTN